MDDATTTVQLVRPFKNLEGVPQTYVTMRTQLLVGDWRAANKQTKDGEERTFLLVCRLCGLDTKEVEQLAMSDFQKLADMIKLGEDDEDPKG